MLGRRGGRLGLLLGLGLGLLLGLGRLAELALVLEVTKWRRLRHRERLGRLKHPELGFFGLYPTQQKEEWVIREGEEFSPEVSGELVCYFNDVQLSWFYGNNSGWVVLEVTEVA